MNWTDVGSWIKDNAAPGAALVGSLLTGNVPGAVAAGVALVSGATGTADPAAALQALQGDPSTMVRLRELANEEAASIRQHMQEMTRMQLDAEAAADQRLDADRADARGMQRAALAQDDQLSKRFVYYMAAGWSLFAMAYLLLITLYPIPESATRFADTALGFLLGTVIATMLNFFFGSSSGSKGKDAALGAAVEQMRAKQ